MHGLDLLLFLLCKWSLLGPAGCCFPISPLCSDPSPTGAVFCYPVCSLICSQLLQFGFAEDPQTVVPWARLSLSGGAGHFLLLAAHFHSCSGSAEILLLSALLAQGELSAPGPSVCPVALFLSGGCSCLPLLSAVPCSGWLHRNPWECRWLVDVPCCQHTPGQHSVPLPLCQGWGTAGFEGFSYSWLWGPCVMEEQCPAGQ